MQVRAFKRYIPLMAISLLTEIPMTSTKQKTRTFLVHQHSVLLGKPDKIALRVFLAYVLYAIPCLAECTAIPANFKSCLHTAFQL